MKTKQVEGVIAPGTPHFVGNGFRVNTFIPAGPQFGMERMNPFIMLDYNAKHYFPPAEQPRGVGVHPHKGFETVTIAYKGQIAHQDSSGGGGVIKEGDVQWMTAGSGILHTEYHEENFSQQGGDFQMVQLWVNLPAEGKQAPAKYQAIRNETMGHVELPGAQGTIEVIAGNYKDKPGPATTFTPVHLLNARMKEGGKAEFDFPEHYNTALLVVEGSISVNDQQQVGTDHFCVFENKGESFSVKALEPAVVLVMSAEPIDEPVAAHGPFVMNTTEELKQAFDDFNNGKFGQLT